MKTLFRRTLRFNVTSRHRAPCRHLATGEPFDPERRFVVLNGKKLWYTVEGPPLATSGRKFVAWHGGPGSTFDWRYVAPALQDTTTVRLELPGHGETPPSLVNVEEPRSQEFERIIKEAVAKIEEAEGSEQGDYFVMAHSMGAEQAIGLSDKRSSDSSESRFRVRGTALVSPLGLYPHQGLFIKDPKSSETKWWAKLLLRPWLQAVATPLVRATFVNLFGFSPRPSRFEYYWVMLRASLIDYDRYVASIRRMAEHNHPVHIFAGGNDNVMERPIGLSISRSFGCLEEEVEGSEGREECWDSVNPACSVQRATLFEQAGHFGIKTHSEEIALRLNAWMTEVERCEEDP